MNKHLYRIVFNKARGLLMVVAENVASQGKAPGVTCAPGTVSPVGAVQLKGLRFALMLALGLVALDVAPAWAAGVVADGRAPATQRPNVGQSANGTPQVDIRAPSAAGVSRNTYSQFDVDKRGVILNNSGKSSQTQLGGWIQGNANLGKGNARVILNEVNASNPSQLRGYVEVAGQRAQVVIANPAGITCDGCGFINANRATLTTGQAQLENGRITGYQVKGGTLNIEGKGLDSGGADYTDLIARSVQVNAGIWASDLKVTAGRNQVNADNTRATRLADGSDDKPTVAIDVAQLGGMYAGKIMLVGTEGGVGVRNAGKIGAGVGDVVINADGTLHNTGSISSAGATRISSAEVDNAGTVYAKGDLHVSSAGELRNSGTLASRANAELEAATLHSSKGAALAAGLDEQGKLGRSGNLTVTADTVQAQGENLAGGNVQVTARQVDLSTSRNVGSHITLTASAGDADLRGASVDASQTLTVTASQALRSDAAKVIAGNLKLRAGELSNVGGELAQSGAGATSIKVEGLLDNRDGRIATNGVDASIHAGTLENAEGRIEHVEQGTLALAARTLHGADGVLLSTGTLKVTATDAVLDNSVAQGKDVVVEADRLSNRSGKVLATQNGTLKVTAKGVLDNTDGTLAASGASVIGAATLDNTRGTVSAGGTLYVGGTELLNTGGTFLSVGQMNVVAGHVNNVGGLLRSGALLHVAADSLDNSATLGEGQGVQGRSLRLDTTVLGNQSGSLLAETTLDIGVSQTLDNSAGHLLAGQSLNITGGGYQGDGQVTSLGDLTLRLRDDLELVGLLQANGTLQVHTDGALNNGGKLLAGRSMLLSATTVDNRASGEINADQVRIDAAQSLTNRGLVDGQKVRLQAGALYNLGSGRLYADQLGIAAGTLLNANEGERSAVIAARNRLDLGAGVVDNREAALIFSAGDMAIGASLDAADHATGRATLLTNASATIESLGHMTLDVQTLHNLNSHFSTREVEISRQNLQQFQLSGSPNSYQADQVGFRHNEVQYLITPEGESDRWNRYDITRVVQQTQIATSAPGQILAAGNLLINADEVLNDKSHVIAGGLLQGSIGHLVNSELKGQQITADSGTVTNFRRIQRKGRDRQGTSVAAYVPAPLIQEINLQPTVWQELAAITGSGTQLEAHARQLSEQQVGGAPMVEVPAQTTLNSQGVSEQIRSTGPSLALPSNSLFDSNPLAVRNYLVETDPRFASYRKWLSSDYMLDRLQLDPAATQQRLGDGFYEQKLIREQVAQLTGRRFIDGYASDEEQYRALLDNAVTVATAWQLVPGVALSAEQMAQLTSDIVWLVEKQVTLAGGETRKVLVPQVYVRVQQGDLNGAGALMAGQQLKLDVVDNLTNSGSLGGGSIMALTAQNVSNLGGSLQADKVSVQARENLDNLGGLIGAVDSLFVSAGNDLNVVSSTHDSSSEQGTRTNLSRVAGLFVSGTGGVLKASAGNDLNLVGAQVVNAGANGSTQLVAGNDLNMATVTEAHTQSITWDSSNWRKDASRTEAGSSVQGVGDVSLNAGQDVNLRAATVASTQGAVLLEARRDVNLSAGQDYRFADEAHKSKGGNGMFSSKTTTTRDTLSETLAQGSTVSGEQAYLQAGRDVTVRASNVVSTDKTVVLADNDVNIEAATDTHSERHDKSVKKSGLFSGGGIAVTIGTQQQRVEDLTTRSTAAPSTVGSTQGDVVIAAGKDYRQVGSHVMAPKGDIDIAAERIDILEARNLVQREHETLFKQTGFSITITNPVLTAIQTAQQMKSASEKTEDGRMKALAGATTALAANNAATAVAQSPGAMGGVNISLSIGAQKSQSESTQSADTSTSSTVAAGGNVSLVASGAGADSDITVRGSQIKAGNNALLDAEGDINLLAATNKATQQSDSRGSSASVGIGFAFGGAQNGFTLNLGVAGNRGEADGEDITHTNTRVEAGNLLLMRSGGDTTLKGAVASGKQVVADIGGDLNIESLQDTSTYTVDEKSMSAGLSLCIPPFCWGVSTAGGSLGAGATDIDSRYASVTEQSGIKAGDGGFDIRVGGNTDLVGAVITSSDKAVEEGRNQLVTATLTTRDIKNEAEYDASSVSLGGGYGSAVGKDPNGTVQAGSTQTPGSTLPNEGGFSATLPVALGASDSASSVTRSGISGGLIRVTDDAGQQALTGNTAQMTVASLNRDVSSDRDSSNALKPIFDEQELRAGFEIAGAFTREVGTYLDNKAKESSSAKRLLDEERQKPVDQQDPTRMAALAQTLKDNQTWEFGGTSRAVLMALTAAAGGNISGSGASMLQATAVNYMQGLAAQEIKLIADKLDSEVARTALHTLAGCAGAAAQNASCGSGALGAASSVVINNLVEQISGQEGASLTPEEKEARKNLVSSLITGITVAAGGEAAIANTAAQIEAENNAFWIPVIMGGAWLIDKGMTAYEAWQDIKALEAGTTTLEELAIAKGEDYIMQVVAGNMGKYGMKAVKKAGGWVAEKVGHHSDDVVITPPSPLDPGKLTSRADGLPVERVQAGSKGNWDKTVNGDLKPRTAYELNNGHTYVTDASGRVNSVEGQLSLTTMDRNPYQQCKVGHCGNAGDDGGHLIASSLGGAGDKINMVPQAAKLNRGDWKRMENEMRNALQAGQTVSVKIDIGYPPTGGVRPNEFTVLATIDGRVVPYRFTQ